MTVVATMPRRRRRWWRRIALTLLLAPLMACAITWLVSPKWRLAASIWTSGGVYIERGLQSFPDRIKLRLSGKTGDEQRMVRLEGPEFDDAWLAEHDDLALLQPTSLVVNKTRLSRESLHRLLQKYAFDDCYIYGVPVTDDDAALLGRRPRLQFVILRHTEVTDRGLAALNVARLGLLDVGGSPVTPAALQTAIAGSRLRTIGVDGRQFTPEFARCLGSAPAVIALILSGPEVTDAHLDLITSIPRPQWLCLEETSATPAAIDALRSAHPNRQLEVHVVPAREDSTP